MIDVDVVHVVDEVNEVDDVIYEVDDAEGDGGAHVDARV